MSTCEEADSNVHALIKELVIGYGIVWDTLRWFRAPRGDNKTKRVSGGSFILYYRSDLVALSYFSFKLSGHRQELLHS